MSVMFLEKNVTNFRLNSLAARVVPTKVSTYVESRCFDQGSWNIPVEMWNNGRVTPGSFTVKTFVKVNAAYGFLCYLIIIGEKK